MDFGIATKIDEALVPLAIALYILGVFLKATPKITDWYIPWILLIVSVVAANLILGWSMSASLEGVFACGLAMLGKQLYNQTQIGIRKDLR